MLSEKKLISECLKNNRKAQKELYDRFSYKMMGVCRRYTNSLEDAEDVMIEGFTTVFEKLSMYSGDGSFEGWIRRIMINAAISHYRNNKKHRFHADIDECYDVQQNQETAVDMMGAKQIMKLVETMPDGYRMVFNLFAVEGFSHAEIAQQLGVSEGTSKSQYAKARQWLQCRLQK